MNPVVGTMLYKLYLKMEYTGKVSILIVPA